MGKAIVLFLLIIQFSCTQPQKDSLFLENQFQPETKYDFSSDQTLQTTIKYTGKEKALQKLKSRGLQNPTVINKKSTIKALINAGEMEEGISFPIKATCLITVDNNGQKASPVDVTFHGKCYKDSMPFFDMAIGENLDKKYKMVLLQTWQKNISQLTFNGEQLKIGNEFSRETLIFMPMEGSEIEMVVKTNYKLLSIKNNRADIDITQQYTMSPKLLDNSFDGTGNGKGYLVYDIDKRIVVNYHLNTEMVLHKKLDSFEFELNTKSGYNQSIKILGK